MKRNYKSGCWGDGSLGHQYVRTRLALLIAKHDSEEQAQKFIDGF